MQRLENYFFGRVGKRQVMIPDKNQPYTVGGICYDFDGVPDGSLITAEVKSINGSTVEITSGKKLLLDQAHPDYRELISAKGANIPIIDWWWIDETAPYDRCFYGKVGDKVVTGEITDQEGNYLSIDDVLYYVIWCNTKQKVPFGQKPEAGLRFNDLPSYYQYGSYMNFPHVRPVLFF